MFKVKQLQMDITHQCNFQCDGCAHYANFALKESTPYDVGKDWLTGWSKRIQPELVTILGGEPTLHPELISYLELIAKLWPHQQRRLFSNGYFLDKHAGLAEVLARTNTLLLVTTHFDEGPYYEKLLSIVRRWDGLSKEHGFAFEMADARTGWYKAYLGEGKTMQPFHDQNPRASWEICISRWCMQLHQGRLYKCPPLAYLEEVTTKFGIQHSEEWAPYLQYRGLGLEATDRELEAFLRQEEESACGMCPAQNQPMASHGHSPEVLAGKQTGKDYREEINQFIKDHTREDPRPAYTLLAARKLKRMAIRAIHPFRRHGVIVP